MTNSSEPLREHPSTYFVEDRSNEEAHYKDMRHGFRTVRPFIQKWGCTSQDYDAVYQQALTEMQQSNFHVTLRLLTVWGSPYPHK